MATVGSEPQPHSQLASGIVQTNMNSLGCSNLPLNRGLERALEEAANSGLLNLSARKLKEFPRTALNHDLTDTVQADLSKNRLTEVPVEVCHFVSLEILNLYHNCVKVIPDAIVSLHMLTYLNLSRNQLSVLPACLCGLPLKVLIASNNKLGALPEEIGQLNQLMELDISCNEITALPQQIGQLKALRELSVRRNVLSILPDDLVNLPLVKLDFSCNKVAVIPVCYRKMSHLQTLQLDNNPLQSPPAQICIKGKVHIFKYLYMEACRIDKTVDSLYLPVIERLSLSQPAAGSIEDIDQSRKQDTDSGLGSDNGDKRLSATEPSDEDTVSLNAPMSNITEEESFSKEDSSEHMNPFKEESDQESVKLIENNNPEERPQDKFVYGGPGLSTPFVTYMKGRAAEFDEPLRIEEDTSWATEPMTNPPDNQEIHIEMINQLREAVELLQDPNRLNMNTEARTGVQLYPVHTTENLNSSVNGQTYQDVSMTRMRESIGGELEFQKKRELILGKARVEAQLACQRFERQLSNQSNSKTLEGQNDVRRASVDGGEDKTPASSPTTNTPFGLKPRSDQPLPSSPPPSSSPLTQALAGDNAILTTPTGGGMTNSVFLRTPRKLESMDPQFTIRRKMEQMREELDLMDQLRENIESRLKVVLPADLGSSLMDGVVLCHLVNHIHPRSVVSIHVPSPAVPKLSMAKCRRNVENFLDACRKMGVPEADLCTPYDILQSDICHIRKTVCALLTRGDTSTQPPPVSRPWDLFGFGLLNLFCLVLLFIAYNWSALI
ncbi:leucine-rich repeat and calponin homology domain-containing protein 1-like isoform X1 [Polyodon spathula]|uniref:leucine-rich repeat and calponin homology domain-containing protein 1-like isoform X1 n=1 Tax=Polyodon spathula TaxID=7913 RepID=UPI001B7DFB9D|nr:leucine-rich repeat and calponin homology domain-containing protein 1-like isoform X1 [Polyodon spathula]